MSKISFGIGECSRCGTTAQLNWCICEACSDKAQNRYRDEVNAFAKEMSK